MRHLRLTLAMLALGHTAQAEMIKFDITERVPAFEVSLR